GNEQETRRHRRGSAEVRLPMAADPWWALLRAGTNDRALHLLREAYAKESTLSCAMELGVVYLWIGDYEAAWQHFHGFAEAYPNHADSIYGMAGVAKWCLNEP